MTFQQELGIDSGSPLKPLSSLIEDSQPRRETPSSPLTPNYNSIYRGLDPGVLGPKRVTHALGFNLVEPLVAGRTPPQVEPPVPNVETAKSWRKTFLLIPSLLRICWKVFQDLASKASSGMSWPGKVIGQDFLTLRNWLFSISPWRRQPVPVSKGEPLWNTICSTSDDDELLRILRTYTSLEEFIDDYELISRFQTNATEAELVPEMSLESLHSWAFFLIDFVVEDRLPFAKFTVSETGLAQLEWRLSEETIEGNRFDAFYGEGRGVVDLVFLPSSMIELTVVSGPYDDDIDRISFSGCFPHEMAKMILRVFFQNRLQSVYA